MRIKYAQPTGAKKMSIGALKDVTKNAGRKDGPTSTLCLQP